ncbi:DnaD domain-containing protein [Lysinibacillus odysseyi]|nr:DnaD domain protein [Lysinibacillus odysseyi]
MKGVLYELVVYAMQLAIESNKVSWSYVEGILKNWANKKIKTVEQAEA